MYKNFQRFSFSLLALIFLVVLFIDSANAFGFQNNNSALLDKVKKSVVNIRVQVIKVPYTLNSLYRPLGTGQGTGFIIDEGRGLILTNKHISDTYRIDYLEVTFFNGKEAQAKLIYSDPWHDFAIIAVNKKDIPSDVNALQMSKKNLKVGQEVFMLGNNQAQALSIQTGTVSSIYQSFGFFPNQSVRISLNSRGGSSGSPVCNELGEAIALQCGGDDTFAHALPIQYVSDALTALNQDRTPSRRDTGALLGYYSLDRAVRFDNFPKEEVANYAKAFPEARSNALIVDEIFSDAPAHGVLKIGDIIWTVNGEKIGPNLYQMQSALNASKDKIKIGVYRKGTLKNLEVDTYDLESARLREMVSFGGAMFFKADDMTRLLAGAKLGEIFIGYIQPGASFEGKIPEIALSAGKETSLVKILRFNDKIIDKLETLVQLIPSLVQRRDLVVECQNYLFDVYYNNTINASRRNFVADVRYSGYDDVPTYFKYNDKLTRWDNTHIIEEKSDDAQK